MRSYEWWPVYQPHNFDVADRAGALLHFAGIATLGGILAIPAVAHATGISAASVAVLLGAHLAWYFFSAFVLTHLESGPARVNAQIAGNLTVNIGVAVAIPIATRDPSTPLWMLPVLYACLNGAMQERKLCITFLLAHALTPLLAYAVLLDGRPRTPWSIAAPLLCAVLCTVAYNHTARMAAHWRELRGVREAELAELRARVAHRDRERLMQDVQDSLGSTLSVVGTYGDLVERFLDRPLELRAVAAMVREAARAGLGDLRGVLDAIAPAVGDLDGVAATWRQAAERTPIAVTIRREGANVPVTGAVRLVLVRAFQDALRNASRHIDVCVAVHAETLSIVITDDGSSTRTTIADDRVVELGGALVRTRTPDDGVHIRITLPREIGQ